MSAAPHIISELGGAASGTVKVRRALLSVSDKEGIVDFGRCLQEKHGVELVSTGGTARVLREAGLAVKDVSELTGSPEMLDGRVKTLHPKVHGGILYVRGNESHEKAIAEHNVPQIDMVVVNLYAFEAAVSSGRGFEACVENIDIGGPSMVRSSAKNHKYVTIVTSPEQYAEVLTTMNDLDGATSPELRRKLAAQAFSLTAQYDAAISNWFGRQLEDEDQKIAPAHIAVGGKLSLGLKYGCNPHQAPAALYNSPVVVRNGKPGYINLLDALNAYQLVRELRESLQVPAAASFKHVSPAGAGLGLPPVSDDEKKVYDIKEETLTPLALAYIRARQADPMCSFGDFVALSDVVDLATAMVLKKEVSDGIIAPGFEPDALKVLAAKKGGNFVCLELDPSYIPSSDLEYRQVFGVGMAQKRNDRQFATSDLGNVVTKKSIESEQAVRDLVLASITCKYTQSNSVCYARRSQVIGVGAGQQSRVDCVKLAASKLQTWWLRFHPKLSALPFKAGVKRQEKVNARVRFIQGGFAKAPSYERDAYLNLFEVDKHDAALNEFQPDEIDTHLASLSDVALASDAFFPFRDNVDVAARYGVQYIAQAGGSVQDKAVIEACDQHKIAMAFTGIRLFHH